VEQLNQKLINNFIVDDCLNILPQIEDETIDLILTDPPYNILNTNLIDFENNKDFISLENEFLRILKPNGLLLTFASWQLWFSLFNKWKKLKFWYEMIIVRSNGFSMMYKKRPVNRHEYLLVFYKNKSDIFFNEREMGEYKKPYERGLHQGVNSNAHASSHKKGYHKNEDGFRKPTSILKMKTKNHFKQDERTKHPTQKEILLLEKLIKTYCPENGLVLDPFAGVGTVAIACNRTNRNHISIEIDQQWFQEYIKLKEKEG